MPDFCLDSSGVVGSVQVRREGKMTRSYLIVLAWFLGSLWAGGAVATREDHKISGIFAGFSVLAITFALGNLIMAANQ